jgi:hypothetical protein
MTSVDICEGYYWYFAFYHRNGLTNRCVATGRTITKQLHRLRFRISPLQLKPEGEALIVYENLVKTWENNSHTGGRPAVH